MLAYFAKHNEQEALPLVEKALSELEIEQGNWLLDALTKLTFSTGIDSILKQRLELDEPAAASHAAYLISKYGPASDEKVLLARLERWSKEWRDRAAEADTNLQGTVERELMLGLISAKSWKLSEERVAELRRSCVSKYCRESVQRR